MGGKTQKK